MTDLENVHIDNFPTPRQIFHRIFDRGIPDYMIGGFDRYYRCGILPGSFATAVMVNDLAGACRHADDTNKRLLGEYVAMLYNDFPTACWGSTERVHEWNLAGGYEGLMAKADQETAYDMENASVVDLRNLGVI